MLKSTQKLQEIYNLNTGGEVGMGKCLHKRSCCLLWWPGNFIAKEDKEDKEENEWPEFAQHDGLEMAAQPEEIASKYKAHTAKDYCLESSADPGYDDNVNPTSLKMHDEVRVNRRNLALWSFKMPMSLNVWMHFKY